MSQCFVRLPQFSRLIEFKNRKSPTKTEFKNCEGRTKHCESRTKHCESRSLSRWNVQIHVFFPLPIYALFKFEIEDLRRGAQFYSGYIWVLSGYRIQKRISQLDGRYFCLAHLTSSSGHATVIFPLLCSLTPLWFCGFVDLTAKMIRLSFFFFFFFSLLFFLFGFDLWFY